MKTFSHTIDISGNTQKVWKLWENVRSWNTWDTSIEKSDIEWEFVLWAKWKILPKKWPKISFTISQIQEGISFSNSSKIPWGKIEFYHVIEKNTVTHGFCITGITAAVFWAILWKQISKDIILSLENIKNLCVVD